MKSTLIAALCASLCAGPTAALVQDEDDWEFQHEPSLNQMVAAVRYDAGVAIVVQCRDGALSAALVGMPPVPERFELKATRADGRSDTQAWVPGAGPGVFLSTVPARDIRFMRGGGLYSVRTEDGAARALRTDFDLPTQSANLDRVLTACGWALTDDRDALARADGVSLTNPEGTRFRQPPRSSRPRANGGGRPARPEPRPVGTPVLPLAEGQISCIVRDMQLTDCRADHPATAAGGRAGADSLRGTQRRPLFGDDPAAAEGKVLYLTGGTVTVIDYIATVPAR
ncbi:MAG: hypothetical protein ACXW3O_07070 [Brevundimonas sp.]